MLIVEWGELVVFRRWICSIDMELRPKSLGTHMSVAVDNGRTWGRSWGDGASALSGMYDTSVVGGVERASGRRRVGKKAYVVEAESTKNCEDVLSAGAD